MLFAEVMNFNSGNVTLTMNIGTIGEMTDEHNATITAAEAKSQQITTDANALKKLVDTLFLFSRCDHLHF